MTNNMQGAAKASEFDSVTISMVFQTVAGALGVDLTISRGCEVNLVARTTDWYFSESTGWPHKSRMAAGLPHPVHTSKGMIKWVAPGAAAAAMYCM